MRGPRCNTLHSRVLPGTSSSGRLATPAEITAWALRLSREKEVVLPYTLLLKILLSERRIRPYQCGVADLDFGIFVTLRWCRQPLR